MSRKISIQEKKKWLEMFEQGKTENQIAKAVKKDLRTIVSGLQEASKDRHLAAAEFEMLRAALSNHQSQLITTLKSISSMLVMPPSNLELRVDENGILAPTSLSGARIDQSPEKEIMLTIHDEEKLEWELLQEHLKSDKLWTYLERWRQVLIHHIQTRYQFREYIKTSLEEETGLKFKERNAEMKEYLVPQTVDLLFGIVMNRIQAIKDGTDLEHNIIVRGDVFVGHSATELAHCKDNVACRDKIISVFTSLPASPAGRNVKTTLNELSDITRRARRQADEIVLLGMIMGKCRVCTRLGK